MVLAWHFRLLLTQTGHSRQRNLHFTGEHRVSGHAGVTRPARVGGVRSGSTSAPSVKRGRPPEALILSRAQRRRWTRGYVADGATCPLYLYLSSRSPPYTGESRGSIWGLSIWPGNGATNSGTVTTRPFNGDSMFPFTPCRRSMERRRKRNRGGRCKAWAASTMNSKAPDSPPLPQPSAPGSSPGAFVCTTGRDQR